MADNAGEETGILLANYQISRDREQGAGSRERKSLICGSSGILGGVAPQSIRQQHPKGWG